MPFQVPENLAEVEDIEGAINEALDEFRGLGLGDESSEEDITRGEELGSAITALRTEKTTRADAATARADRLAALADVDAVSDEGTDDGGDPAPVAEVVEPEPVAEATQAEPEVIDAPVPVAASGAVKRAARKAPAVVLPNRPAAVITAAADVPGMSMGMQLDGLGQAADAVSARISAMPNRLSPGQTGGMRYGAALIRKQGYGDLVQAGGQDDYELVHETGREARLAGGSLVASGGWCAPSETVWDMCVYESVEGLLDMPEFQVTRAGIRYTQGIDFTDIYQDSCYFHYTEPELEAGGVVKPCCQVHCNDWEEIRLNAEGLCVRVPFLVNSAYPELVRRFTEGVMVAYAHKQNAWLIDQIGAAAGAAHALPDYGSTFMNLDGLVWRAISMREQYRLPLNASMEVVAPYWFKETIRIDLARREGREWQNVTDAEIDSWFATRNISVQWVYDYQDIATADCTNFVPTEAEVLMYPAGTWAKGTKDVISLDTIYDHDSVTNNVFTALFVENGVLAVQKCLHTCALTIPVVSGGLIPARATTTAETVFTGAGVLPVPPLYPTPGWPGSTPTGPFQPTPPYLPVP